MKMKPVAKAAGFLVYGKNKACGLQVYYSDVVIAYGPAEEYAAYPCEAFGAVGGKECRCALVGFLSDSIGALKPQCHVGSRCFGGINDGNTRPKDVADGLCKYGKVRAAEHEDVG